MASRRTTEWAATPLSDRELWACALKVEQLHGNGAPQFIAERIGALALAGDMAGLETWRAIAARVDERRRAARN